MILLHAVFLSVVEVIFLWLEDSNNIYFTIFSKENIPTANVFVTKILTKVSHVLPRVKIT